MSIEGSYDRWLEGRGPKLPLVLALTTRPAPCLARYSNRREGTRG